MKKLMLTAAMSLVVALSSVAIAQERVGPNGGMVAGKGGHETELIVSATELTVYLLDGGKAHATKGSNVKAVVQEAGKSINVALKDVDNKKLVGKLAAPLGKGAIIVLTGKDDHGHSIAARYVLK